MYSCFSFDGTVYLVMKEGVSMKIGVICDDYWHPGSVVEAGLAPLKETGLEFSIMKDATNFAIEKMQEYPVIIFSKSNHVSATNREKWMTSEIQQAFVEYIETGGSLLVIHSGIAGYGEEKVFTNLIGSTFLQHPEQCPVTIQPLKKHPITAEVENFIEKDEHYFVDIISEDVDVFMITTSKHGAQVGGYTRHQGKGKIAVLTPGHNQEVWLHPNYQKMLKNAIEWCGGY